VTASAATTPDRAVSFTPAQAARIARCKPAQLRYWHHTGLVARSAPDGGYSFRDLVALRLVRSLLDAGVSTARARAALTALRDAGADLSALRVVTDGRRVWACHDDEQILDALRAGQLALFIAVDQVAADVDSDVRIFTRERDDFVDRLVAR
jgi:DNA-binding transcriptional MerR regulator